MADHVEDNNELDDVDIKSKPMLYGYTPNTPLSKRYHKLQIVAVAIICLLLGTLVGILAQEYFDSIHVTENSNNFDNFNIAGLSGTNRVNRKNEAECKRRRCCKIRDNLKKTELPKGLNCKRLTDVECGVNDAFCEWDCDKSKQKQKQKNRNKKKFKKRYRGISLKRGIYHEPDEFIPTAVEDPITATNTETFQECLDAGKMISVDDCGVQYDEELDHAALQLFCENHPDSGVSNETESVDVNEFGIRRRLTRYGDGSNRIGPINSDSFPFSAVVQFQVTTSSGVSYICTATMISSLWAITAAHCVWGDNGWIGDGIVYVNRIAEDDYDKTYRVVAERLFQKYIDYLEEDSYKKYYWDMAFLKLEAAPNVGTFGIGYNSDLDDLYEGEDVFYSIMYPGDKPRGTKWLQKCAYDKIGSDYLGSDECFYTPGESGSSVFVVENSKPEIYGIMCAFSGTFHKYNGKGNIAAQITASKYRTITALTGAS